MLALAAAWLVLAYQLFYRPSVSPVGGADAVVVLAGAGTERLAVGQELVASGRADELVLSSTGLPGNAEADELCAEERPGIICFRPEPLTTRGEARAIADLARERGWERITVVTSAYHVTRASINISQCSKATVAMAVSRPDLGVVGWLARFVEETVALAGSFVRPACAGPV